MTTKEVSYSLDLRELDRIIQEKYDALAPDRKSLNPRSTVFALGDDPRVGKETLASPPDFYIVKSLKDRLENPYLQLHWRVLRSDIDAGKIIGFNVFRRRSPLPPPTFKGIQLLSRAAIDRLSRRNKKVGKFFEDRKAIYNVKRGSVPIDVLNPNLSYLQEIANANAFQDLSEDALNFFNSDIDRLLNDKKFEKIAYVDYSKFLQQEKNKFVFVKDRNFVELSYKDKRVGYWETFEYYISAVTKQLDTPPRSNVILVSVENVDRVAPPISLIAKQTSKKEVQLSIIIRSKDNVSSALVFRRAEDEVEFEKLIEAPNVSDRINVIDSTVEYSKTYIYRVFLQNIHGNLSEPKEVEFYSSDQTITATSRSNSLKIPIMSAVQDQNSNFIKITISPNDPRVAFYELQRRDLSIFEKKFSVPSALETNYGGIGWQANKFFVQKDRVPLSTNTASAQLNTRTVMREIIFIDDITQEGHIYQYRVRGYDLKGNPTSYAFSMARSSGKKSIRAPINVKSEILRNFPYRVRISWDDDNLLRSTSQEELLAGSLTDRVPTKIVYKIERRSQGQQTYESFPLTANKFFIDEGPADDAIVFESRPSEVNYERQPNTTETSENITILGDVPKRAFQLPDFLKKNEVYFYRITAIADNGEESNPTAEFRLITLLELSNPIGLGVEVANTKVRPTVARIYWKVDPLKATPDFWTIERRFDVSHDSFAVIGKAYLLSEFFDKNVETGNNYVYRIKGYDSTGRETPFFETRLSL